ncbi:MAG: DUF504 domain-containing protein [Thermoplasmatota archaeon]
MSHSHARDVLLKERWSSDSIEDLYIEYIDRGAADDRSILQGSEIVHIGRSFLELSGGSNISFHRVTRIYRGKELIWERFLKGGP